MIKRLIVKNLNGRFDFDLTFHRDLNILVGQNGCGKTSLLKLMWYVYSGNIYRFDADLVFDFVELHTTSGDSVKFEQNRVGEKSHITCIVDEIGIIKPGYIPEYTKTNNTVFMPTFRRMEGGIAKDFTDNTLSIDLNQFSNLLKIQEIIPKSKKMLSHRFVASLSSRDIINVVLEKYSDISQELRKLQETESEFILKNTSNGKGAETALKDIQAAVKTNDKKRKEILNAMTVLSNLVKKIIKNKEIQLTEKLTLGEGNNINPDQLSYGEKQMLSFLCYNFFADDSILFIDEPEMSLHVDWQRILFPVLMEQNTTNQFIVATHSPFIYAQYQDKQIELKQQELVTV